ncbi:MAG: metallophosphoesterase [Balneolaceae bacterium]|nr:metallophosphoesterase [Balneolaceae bacterium]
MKFLSSKIRYTRTFIMLIFIAIFATGFASDTKKPAQSEIFNPISVGLLPDTQGSGEMVSIYPMDTVLQKFRDLGVDIVIPVGDLVNQGATHEFEDWTRTAEKYRDAGMEFLPLMGNHERSFAYTVEWIENMKDFIPEDAVHMQDAQYLNYYVVRENVLIIVLKYYHLSIAFQWIKEVVEEHRGDVDHIIIGSHDGLIGAKYGQTREMIVEGTKGNDLLMDQWDDIRSFFSRHDVIWVQGHEHMYQRSVIEAPIHLNTGSWMLSDGNYRLPQYTQIVSGNASYKGYEYRYGEREKVQAVIQHKMNTMENGSEALDANASVLFFDNSRVDYESWFTSHTVTDNDQGRKELENPEWTLMDRFSRTTNRCERIVYPNSIPESTRPVMVYNASYRTNECFADDGSTARLLDGTNNIFNRVDTTPRTLSWRPGFSRAQSQMDLARLAYQYLFQDHRPWDPNLNRNERLEAGENEYEIEIPATTIDLKEHITLSWLPATNETVSDIMIVSGTQNHSGVYSGAWGEEKDIETDTGYPKSQPDGTAKQPHTLPSYATKGWDVESAVADTYVLQFDGDSDTDPDRVIPAYYDGVSWQPFTSAECVLEMPYEEGFIEVEENLSLDGACSGETVVGFDSSHGNRWWLVLNSDIEVALIER